MTRILLVEDEPRFRKALTMNLRARHHTVTTAADATTALNAAAANRPDLVILDLGLPDMDGLHVIRELRVWTPIPIIVLSARYSQPDKVQALDAGADDYLSKPFGMEELLARIRAALRRAEPAPPAPTIRTSAFTVDLGNKIVSTPAGDVRLTPTEWHLLEVLARHPGKLLEHKYLLHEVWGPAYSDQSNYLRVYMAQLRRKLEPDPSHPRHLLTEPGLGYRLRP
jgi:two-component system KDP operon response regulator KdpE